uniref:Uncharacterized protein n=1 Tax=uncultured marine virus TaxID=186617 RepID=A0A0F7L4S2_9VIRU|nr:hypothetical protein [uncultured marine virus]
MNKTSAYNQKPLEVQVTGKLVSLSLFSYTPHCEKFKKFRINLITFQPKVILTGLQLVDFCILQTVQTF